MENWYVSKDDYEVEYYYNLADNFKAFDAALGKLGHVNKVYKDERIIVDCSNGVGGQKIEDLLKLIDIGDVTLINQADAEYLNV